MKATEMIETTCTAFTQMLIEAQQRNNSLLCVGLDPDLSRFPSINGSKPDSSSIIAFNRAIIEATSDLACCYKPNLGFYLHHGYHGIDALIDLRKSVPSHIPVLLDAKVGDINTTTAAYAQAYFDAWNFDGVTVNPFMGKDSIEPLLAYREKGIYLLSKTSNPGSGFLQDQEITGTGERISHMVARTAVEWNVDGNIGLVVGATWPGEMRSIREVAPDLPILVPGVGAQEGELEASVAAGIDCRGAGLFINASRAISYASQGEDFQDAARAVAIDLRDRINSTRAAATTA